MFVNTTRLTSIALKPSCRLVGGSLAYLSLQQQGPPQERRGEFFSEDSSDRDSVGPIESSPGKPIVLSAFAIPRQQRIVLICRFRRSPRYSPGKGTLMLLPAGPRWQPRA